MQARLADQNDAPEVLRLVSGLLLELGGKALEPRVATPVYQQLLREPGLGFAVLGESQTRAVAVCTVSLVHALRSGGRYAIVQEMYVEPELRGSGIGRDVLALALTRARELGCPFVELGTPFQGERQIAFYRRSGFVNIGARLRCALA
jgi:GNAT superfamily N-acetyltransferase